MTRPPVLLVHGAATTSSVWDQLVPHLTGLELRVPDRPCTGDLDSEVDFLRPLAEDAVVVGVGGGATLGLALLSRGVPLAGALLHEPAAGSLVPGLLDGFARAHAEGGVAAFARALYGDSWTPDLAPGDPDAVRRDLTMFRGFEPSSPTVPTARVLTSVGELSPPVRHQVCAELESRFALRYVTILGCSHAVHLEAPERLAARVWSLVAAGN